MLQPLIEKSSKLCVSSLLVTFIDISDEASKSALCFPLISVKSLRDKALFGCHWVSTGEYPKSPSVGPSFAQAPLHDAS